MLRRLFRKTSELGQTLVEYALIIALLVIAVLAFYLTDRE